MKVVLTGARGFIGTELSKYLMAHGSEVWALSRDILFDQPSITDHLKEISPDVVIHCAAYGNLASQTDDDDILATNVIKTKIILNACKDSKTKPLFVFLSTSSVYADSDKPMYEDWTKEPQTHYASSKLYAEFLVKNSGLKSLIIRPFSVYGPGDREEHFIPKMIEALRFGEAVTLVDGVHDWVFVKDLVTIIGGMASKKITGIFNIGTGKQTTNKEVIEILEKVTEKKFKKIKSSEAIKREIRRGWCGEVTLLNSYGFNCSTSLEDGLKHTWDALQSEDVVKRSLEELPSGVVTWL